MNLLDNKKILILGLGITGREVLDVALSFSCEIFIVDDEYYQEE